MNKVLKAPLPEYDPRLSIVMNIDQYEVYSKNEGHTYYVFLNKLVRELAPKKVLELGTSIGRSALFMMCALPPDSTLTTVDIGSYRRMDLLPFDSDPRLNIVFGNDLEESTIKQVGSGFDLLYIDSEHSYEQVSKEWEIYQHKITNDAIVVMDDIHFNEGMDKFWDSISYEKMDLGNSLHFSGYGAFQFSGS
jgi:predicted O-methyltransferase YrrM